MTNGGEGAFDRIGCTQMFPVFGRELVEGEQYVAILDQTFDRLLVLHAVNGHKCIQRGFGSVLSPDISQ